GARSELSELGIPQQRLIDDALAEILAGSDGVYVVTGGEARRWARSHPGEERAAAEDAGGPGPSRPPDVVHRRGGEVVEPVEVRLRLFEPVLQYAMIESALVAAEERSVPEGRAEVAALWQRFNEVARANPHAAFPAPLDAAAIDTPSPENRPLAFPYNKWHASQWTVDQAAALVLCSVETARRHAVPPDRWVFPLVGLDSSHSVSLLARSHPHRWPAMAVLGRAAEARVGRRLGECDVVEVYSCFPSAVRVQQRELGLDPEGTPTVTGGMAFAGGPFNNFVLQSTVEVVSRLRGAPGALGVVTTVSGLLTKPGLAVWSSGPDGRPPLVADMAGECATATGTRVVADDPGPGRGNRPRAAVVTATVAFEGMEPRRTVALCDLDDGRRAVATSESAEVAALVMGPGIAGREVALEGAALRLA
ncbi:MAG TPA: hypothetical protein VKW77_09790, partial [Acidimicrobiales bacterium]|nr:hypothetical protein [Acidimicrobiales bacterium]